MPNCVTFQSLKGQKFYPTEITRIIYNPSRAKKMVFPKMSTS